MATLKITRGFQFLDFFFFSNVFFWFSHSLNDTLRASKVMMIRRQLEAGRFGPAALQSSDVKKKIDETTMGPWMRGSDVLGDFSKSSRNGWDNSNIFLGRSSVADPPVHSRRNGMVLV